MTREKLLETVSPEAEQRTPGRTHPDPSRRPPPIVVGFWQRGLSESWPDTHELTTVLWESVELGCPSEERDFLVQISPMTQGRALGHLCCKSIPIRHNFCWPAFAGRHPWKITAPRNHLPTSSWCTAPSQGWSVGSCCPGAAKVWWQLKTGLGLAASPGESLQVVSRSPVPMGTPKKSGMSRAA